MSELISGKEAMLAWYDDKEVLVRYKGDEWRKLTFPEYGTGVFKSENHTFRIKPRTITINGVEVPAPFKPKMGERFYHIYPYYVFGYDYQIFDGDVKHDTYVQFGAWKTEDEIQQVVEALRSIFNVQ